MPNNVFRLDTLPTARGTQVILQKMLQKPPKCEKTEYNATFIQRPETKVPDPSSWSRLSPSILNKQKKTQSE